MLFLRLRFFKRCAGNKHIFNISTLLGSSLPDWLLPKLEPLSFLEVEN